MRVVLALLALLISTSASLPADNTPFFRIGNPLIFRVTASPTQYPISRPANATSYRFVNPCLVDVRILKVPDMSTEVTSTTGTRYLARSVEVVATSEPKFVSLIAMTPPNETCDVELQYGAGN